MALLGVGFGVASSAITAIHSVVIKKSLDVVKGSAMNLSWYTNLLSAMLMIPLIILAGEGPAIMDLIFGQAERIAPAEGELSELQTFIWGSFITVCASRPLVIRAIAHGCVTTGRDRLYDEPRKSSFNQGDFANHTHGVFCCQGRRSVFAGHVVFWGHYLGVRVLRSLFCVVNFVALCSRLPVRSGRASSIATILLGSMYYTWVKHVESQQSSKDAGQYERVPMDDVEAAKESGMKPKPE